jgi:hypothetical protein
VIGCRKKSPTVRTSPVSLFYIKIQRKSQDFNMSYVMQNGSETFCIELPRIETPVFVPKLLQRQKPK